MKTVGTLAIAVLTALTIAGVAKDGEAADWRESVYRDEGADIVIVGKAFDLPNYLEGKEAAVVDALSELMRQTGFRFSLVLEASRTEDANRIAKRLAAAGEAVIDGVSLIDEKVERDEDAVPPKVSVWVRMRVSKQTLARAKAEQRKILEAPRRAYDTALADCETAGALGRLGDAFRACLKAYRGAEAAGASAMESIDLLVTSLGSIRLAKTKSGSVRATSGSNPVSGFPIQFLNAKADALASNETDGHGLVTISNRAAFAQPDVEALLRQAGGQSDDPELQRLMASAMAKRISLPRRVDSRRVIVLVKETVFGKPAEHAWVAEKITESLADAGFQVIADAHAGKDSGQVWTQAFDSAKVYSLRSAFAEQADLVITGWVTVQRGPDTNGFSVARADAAVQAISLKEGTLATSKTISGAKGMALDPDAAARNALNESADALVAALLTGLGNGAEKPAE